MIKTPITDSVSTSITATLIATPLENDSATGGSPASVEAIPDPVSFTTDSWATIQKAVQNNNTSVYNVGDTKTVTINNADYTVRIANKSTEDWCDDENYSQTACGFVVEFQDIITTMKMRDTDTNVGGYPATLVYDYLKNTLYGQLPSDLQSVIEPTRVISGYGCLGEWDDSTNTCSNLDNNGNNFISLNQNLYLLSGVEVLGSDNSDTAADTTTQLEYYQNSSNSQIKKYWWWFRSASSQSHGFSSIYFGGKLGLLNADNTGGVSPAFRIG